MAGLFPCCLFVGEDSRCVFTAGSVGPCNAHHTHFSQKRNEKIALTGQFYLDMRRNM